MIAMSFPSKGKEGLLTFFTWLSYFVWLSYFYDFHLGTTALYRNKIDCVAKFFEEKYSDERNIDYMIYNLCSERDGVRPQ